ncbi:HlyD family type I secretion periplasmic adaptor subunit [Paenirhodobacter sp.]|uniref:HlyD family type I secretion periplasmic adaptor subunit n=1 Tax=Paenirhodobacter sp. TaxID=1965326 RepID=UPI003B40F337
MSAANLWDDDVPQSYRSVFVAALALICALAVTFGGWAMYARLDGAVVTQGVVLAESKRKTVENLEGGILAELLVRPGDRVVAGQPVAQLDTTQDQERLAQMEVQRKTLVFDIWRLAAEVAGAAALDPATAPERDAGQIEAQLRLFDARLRLQEGQIASLNRQTELLAAQAAANEAQSLAAERQIASWQKDRESSQTLVARGATPEQKLRELDRNIAILEGERDEYHSLATAAERDKQRVAADIATLEHQRIAESSQKLADAQRALPGLLSQMRAAEDILNRRTLRAPQDGLVVDIPVVTPGAVIGSGAVVMEIVPDADDKVIQTRLPPEAIDSVYVGRPARVRLTAYRRAVAPTIPGEVTYVSADLLQDPRDGTTYFEARVTLDPGELGRHPDVQLSSGMPVEVAVQTGERRAGDYLLEPILRHLRKAMRDE